MLKKWKDKIRREIKSNDSHGKFGKIKITAKNDLKPRW